MKTKLARKSGLAAALAATIGLYAGHAGAQDFRASEFRAHRTAAVKAVNAGDFATAESEIASARAMLPSAPSVLLLGAQIEIAAGRPEAARPWIEDYVRRGLWFDATRYPALFALLDDTGKAALAANGSNFGSFTKRSTIEGRPLIEAIASDGDQLYANSVHEGGLNVIDHNSVRVVHALPSGLGAYGLAIRHHQAWLAISPGTISGPTQALHKPAIRQLDLRSGAILRTFDAPETTQSLGDIAMGKTDLYASDGKSGEVLRLNTKTGTWQTLIPPGRLGSAQGLSENADGTAMIVADYTSGLYRIDTKGGEVTQLPVPIDASLVGIDGVTRSGNDLIAVQNGIQPPRILSIRMSQDWKAIESIKIILRGGALEEPTGGQVIGDRYVFVARSQWSDFEDDGTPKASHGPAVIGEVDLTH